MTAAALKIMELFGWYKPLDYEHRRFDRLAKRCESPIESAFWSCGYWELSRYGIFTPQVEVSPYRLDFALTNVPKTPLLKIAIELDGLEFHKTTEQRNADTARDRYLMRNGWQVVRFTGSQINENCERCVWETIEMIRAWAKWLR